MKWNSGGVSSMNGAELKAEERMNFSHKHTSYF
jgi:hypothetical protein